MAVGTDIGNTYKSSEGFGKAAILPQQADTFSQASVVAKSFWDKVNPKEKPIDKNAILKELKDGKAEWWIAHNADLDNEFNTLLEYGADIMEQNVDPTKNSSDKAAADWQARWAKLENAAKLSMQAKDDFEAFRAVADKEPDKYTDESLAERYAFHARPFNEMKDNYGTPPRLVSKTAPYEYTLKLQDQAKNFVATNKDWENNPEKVTQNARIAFADASRNPGIMDALKPRIDKLTPAEKTDLAQLASTAGFSSPEEYLYAKDFESQLGEKVVPFDLNKVIKETMPGYDITGSTYETPDNFKTTSVQEKMVTPERAKERAEITLKADPSLLQKMIKNGNATDEASAIEALKQGYLNAADKSKVTSTTYNGEGYEGTGYGKEEVDRDWDIYDEVLRGTLDTWKGRKLTTQEKRILRNSAGAYINGVEFDGGKIIAKKEGGKTITAGGSVFVPETGDIDVAQQSMDLGDLRFGDASYGSLPVLIDKPRTVSTSTKKGTTTVSENAKEYDTEERTYSIFDNNKGTHLKPSLTKIWYTGGLKNTKELFGMSIDRVLEENDNLQKMNLSSDYRKAQEEAEKKKSISTPKKGTFDDY